MNTLLFLVIISYHRQGDSGIAYRHLILKNPSIFGPIPIHSSCFGPISGVSRFGPVGGSPFSPISKVGHFGLILGVRRFGLIYLFWENRLDVRLS